MILCIIVARKTSGVLVTPFIYQLPTCTKVSGGIPLQFSHWICMNLMGGPGSGWGVRTARPPDTQLVLVASSYEYGNAGLVGVMVC